MRNIAFLLSLVLVFSIPWEDIVTMGEIGTLTRVIGMLAAAVWLGSALVAREFRKPHPFHVAIFLFIVWNIASFFWSVDIEATIERIKTYVQLAILAWMLWELYTTPKAQRAALQAYVFGAYVSIGSTVSNYLASGGAFAYSGGRYAATGFNPNDLGLILALGIPVAWHLATSAGNGIKDHVLRLVNYAYIPGAFVAIQLTGSRGSLLAVVPALFFILLSLRRLRPALRLLILVLTVAVIFAVQPVIPPATLQRLGTTIDSIAEGDFGGRMIIWRATIDVFAEHTLVGVGSGALRAAVDTVAHNVFLSVMAETGMIGFALFALLLSIAVYEALHQTKRHAWLWLTVLGVLAIGSVVHSWEYRKPTWLFLSLIVISANLFRPCDSVVEDPSLKSAVTGMEQGE